jgi:hypothetical protein
VAGQNLFSGTCVQIQGKWCLEVAPMTEAEWLACTEPTPMLEYLRGKANDRKLRLFACASCRHIWHLLTDPRSREAVEVSEHFADHSASPETVSCAIQAAQAAALRADAALLYCRSDRRQHLAAHAHSLAAHLARATIASGYYDGFFGHIIGAGQANWAASNETGGGGIEPKEMSPVIRALTHDIFGNPFRPVTIDRTCLTSTVTNLAQAIYDERSYERMPILADALEDAGCTNQDILAHCRKPGEHVRGCWVVDLLLGKE